MEENQTIGTAGAALAAHSKDGSVPGPSPASSATVSQDQPGDVSETASEAAGRITSSVHNVLGNARQSIFEQGGHAGDQAAEFIREQPLVALAIMGAACFALGFLLARR